MNIKRTLLPGQAGTKAWLEKYGDNLICVRYRYDKKQKKRLTTVEIAVDENVWEKSGTRIPANKIMHIRVSYGEIETAMIIKRNGGRWNKEGRYWELSYKEVKELGLKGRII